MRRLSLRMVAALLLSAVTATVVQAAPAGHFRARATLAEQAGMSMRAQPRDGLLPSLASRLAGPGAAASGCVASSWGYFSSGYAGAHALAGYRGGRSLAWGYPGAGFGRQSDAASDGQAGQPGTGAMLLASLCLMTLVIGRRSAGY